MSQIEALTVELKVDDRLLLFIMLSADGGVNRLGSGTLNTSETSFYIGQADDRMFRELLPYVDEGWLDRPGDYTARQRKGQDCSLTMVFLAGSEQAEIRYFYGSESEGPPRDIRDFVYAAIDVTQAWYEEQQRMAGKTDSD